MRLIDADELKGKKIRVSSVMCDCEEPRAEGEWITNKDGYSHCSECGFSFGCIACPHEETDFCPNCGAKMDGGKK